jgi:uncharacterized protein (TIGR02117 family)
MSPVVRGACIVVAALLATLALYVGCALLLGAIPRNTGFVEIENGIPVYVRTNGVHAELILPTRSPSFDWSAEFPVGNMRSLAAATDWIAFGWGDRGFMIGTPTWSDLRPGTAIVALSGAGSGAMHVEYIETPAAYKSRRIRISAAEYERLVAYIRASFVRDTDGRVRQIDAPGYFETDAFYEAVPTYTFWYTCNEWTRRALAAAGIRTAMWSPFDTAVFYHLPDASNAR